MSIRTFYWHDRVISPLHFNIRKFFNRSPYFFFKIGNSGDIFTQLIIQNHYNQEAINIKKEGRRLLLVGSIGHTVKEGDLLCGIGVKSTDIPKDKFHTPIHALRGPLSYEAFKNAGYDTSQIKFLKDPGLLIRFYAQNLNPILPQGAGFIPHYRERDIYLQNMPKNMKFIDIDDTPLNIAKHILESEIIYSSSLHGIIFSHALNRPAVLVAPKTEEPIFKYQDYYASIDQAMPQLVHDIHKIDNLKKPVSPIDLTYTQDDFIFPSLSELKRLGIAN
ncbi:MAG: polysaccharide pyruvyl transferase family protein [Cellvibrionales bacterium]|nr:polysaccharide pyruvyl transferase family protein [Cellvibrionales bacterium]